MGDQTYGTAAPRIGKTKGMIYRHRRANPLRQHRTGGVARVAPVPRVPKLPRV